MRVIWPGSQPGELTWQGRLLLWAVTLSTVLALSSLVLPRVPWWPALRDPSQPWVVLLDVRAEGSVHTWVNVVFLTAAALLACVNAAVHRTAGKKFWQWWTVAAVLALFSLDDMLSLHEQLEPLGEQLGGGQGGLHFAWVVPGVVLGALVGLAVLIAVSRLPRRSRVPLLLGITLLLGSAIGLEVAGGAILSARGDGPAYILISHIEELLESVAACLLAFGVLRGGRWSTADAVVSVRPVDA